MRKIQLFWQVHFPGMKDTPQAPEKPPPLDIADRQSQEHGPGQRQPTRDDEAAAAAADAHVAFVAAHLNAMAKVLCSKHERLRQTTATTSWRTRTKLTSAGINDARPVVEVEGVRDMAA